MGKTPRNDSTTGWFHLTNRGARRYSLFIDDADRRLFVRLMRSAADAGGVHIAAFCLMGNHYHVITHCPEGGLSSMMQRLGARYTRAFNAAHGFDGPLFKRRYHSVALASDEQLIAAARYVHRNPLDLFFDPRTYPWSDLLLAPGQDWSPARAELHQLVGGSTEYERCVVNDVSSDDAVIAEGTRTWRSRPRGDRRDLDYVIAAAAAASGVTPEAVLESRATKSNPARLLAILLAVDSGSGGPDRIASRFGLASGSSVRVMVRRARHKLEMDASFRQLMVFAWELHAQLRRGEVASL